MTAEFPAAAYDARKTTPPDEPAGTYTHYGRGRCSACNAHIVCGADCDGAHEGSCRDCHDDVCSKCAAFYEADADCDQDGYVDRSTFLCRECKEGK